jgi:ABC-type dipeptide/oligopeptide/nickel transport system ATPase subunit
LLAPPLCRNIFTPLLVASDLAMVSTMCDDLMEELNAKCVEDISNQKIVAPLIETLLMVNQGQGLGVSWFSRNKIS